MTAYRTKKKPERPQPAGETAPSGAESRAFKAATEAARDARIKQAWDAPENAIVVNTASRQDLLREHEILEATIRTTRAEMGLASFWFFFTEVLFPDSWEDNYKTEFHKPIADYLQNLQPGSNHMFVLPREHRKTTLMMGFVVWLITRDPDIRILWVGAKEKTVKKWSMLTRSVFTAGNLKFKRFQETYPHLLMGKSDGENPKTVLEWTVGGRTKAVADATFTATYLSVTGAGARADVTVFDDPYEKRNCSTPQQSAKATEHTMDLFPLTEMSSAKSKYRMRLFNVTRWAYHDPTGVFIGERHDDVMNELDSGDLADAPIFTAMVRHAFEDPNRLCESCPKHVVAQFPHGHPDVANGTAILDPIFTRADIEKRYKEYVQDPARGESLWYHQYQNVCLSPSQQKFQDSWFQTATFPYWPLAKLRVLAIDSADKDYQLEGVGDWMVALLGEFDDFGRLLCVNGLRSNKWTREEFQNQIVAMCMRMRWLPDRVVKEKYGDGQGSFITDLKSKFERHGHVAHYIIASRPSTNVQNVMKKLDWIVASLQAPFERCHIAFGRDFPSDLRDRAKYELTKLGQIKHDDVADAMALFMAEGVRLVAAEPGRIAPQPQPLDLNFYNLPGMQPQVQPVQFGGTVMDNPAVRLAFSELPTLNTEPVDPKLPMVFLPDW